MQIATLGPWCYLSPLQVPHTVNQLGFLLDLYGNNFYFLSKKALPELGWVVKFKEGTIINGPSDALQSPACSASALSRTNRDLSPLSTDAVNVLVLQQHEQNFHNGPSIIPDQVIAYGSSATILSTVISAPAIVRSVYKSICPSICHCNSSSTSRFNLCSFINRHRYFSFAC